MVRSKQVGESEKRTEEMQNMIREQRKKISESEELESQNRKFADLIYSNLANVEGMLTVIRSAREKGASWQEIGGKISEAKREGIPLADKITSVDPKERTVTLELAGERITTDIRLSAAENASRFYESIRKLRQK